MTLKNKKPSPFLIPLLFLLFPIIVKATPQNTQAFQAKDEIWKEFRHHFAFHIQTIAWHAGLPDGSSLIIISEPPPHTDSLGIAKLFRDYNSLVEIKEHSIGVDGWVKDVVIVIESAKRADLEKTLLLLNRYLHFTNHSTEYLDLAELDQLDNDEEIPTNKLDFDISPLELRQWLLQDEVPFRPTYDSEKTYSVLDLIEKKRLGVYLGTGDRLVIWAIPRAVSLYAFKPEIRKFCLETDVILGSIANEEMVVFVGKARNASLWSHPPLRTESILSLASSQNDYLYQSYERKNPFAAKLDDDQDWAPIALSSELIHTEFGSTLNITDQILKSWSEGGAVAYHGFADYPQPENKMPAVTDMIDSPSITYNWNTNNFLFPAFLPDFDLELVTIDHTGCLPLSYLPDGNPEIQSVAAKVEEMGRNYFRSLNQVDLARVVSYTFLFQAFKTYGIHADQAPDQLDQAIINPLLQRSTELIKKLREHSPHRDAKTLKIIEEKIAYAERQVDTLEIWKSRALSNEKDKFQTQIEERKTRIADLQQQHFDETNQIKKISASVKSIRRYGESGYRLLDTLLVLPHLFSAREDLERDKRFLQISQVATLLKDSLKLTYYAYDFLEQSPEQMMKDFSTLQQRSHHRWLKTPSLVLSRDLRNTASSKSTGGHSLGGEKPKIKMIVEDLEPGTFGFALEGKDIVFKIGAQDFQKLTPEFIQKVEQQLVETNLNRSLQEINQSLKAPIQQIINESPSKSSTTRRLGDIQGLSAKSVNYKPKHQLKQRLASDLKNLSGPEGEAVLYIEKTEFNSCETMIDDIVTYLAKTEAGTANIRLKNVSPEEANVIMQSVKIKSTAQNLRGSRVSKASGKKVPTKEFNFDQLNESSIQVNSGKYGAEVSFSLPKKANPSTSTRISIKGVAQEAVSLIKQIIAKLFQKAKSKSFNFSKELEKELKKANIKYEQLEIELDDCIICYNYGDVHLSPTYYVLTDQPSNFSNH
ncbi:MAG: hypothetical protein HRU41_24775 [Saprospiraceae bacterium]|nr:hypothetical protein [Saprospiraceae bacterium]